MPKSINNTPEAEGLHPLGALIDCDLRAELHQRLQQIPLGRWTTFGDLARSLGDRQAARWVAAHIGQNWQSLSAPWQRVVRQGGQLPTGTIERATAQRALLVAEGHQFPAAPDQVAGEPFLDFVGRGPLAELSAWQQRWGAQIEARSEMLDCQIVGGIDVSYTKSGKAVAALTAVRLSDRQTLWTEVATQEAVFPYIPGYLAFREIPVMHAVWKLAGQRHAVPDVLLVDGNGRLHPRRAGIATMLGGLIEQPTIGVAKHRLCGQESVSQRILGHPAIVHEEEVVGAALPTPSGQAVRLDVSIGWGVTLEAAVRVVQACLTARRSPLPIEIADRDSRAAARFLKAQGT